MQQRGRPQGKLPPRGLRSGKFSARRGVIFALRLLWEPALSRRVDRRNRLKNHCFRDRSGFRRAAPCAVRRRRVPAWGGARHIDALFRLCVRDNPQQRRTV